MNVQVGLSEAAGRFGRRLRGAAGPIGIAFVGLLALVLLYLMVRQGLLQRIVGHHAFVDNAVTECHTQDCLRAALDHFALQVLVGVGLVTLVVLVYARKCPWTAAATALAAFLLLYGKVVPLWDPRSVGLAYAQYAQYLTLDPRLTNHDLVGYRWLSPWLAHALGFNTRAGWLVFLLAAFLAGTVRLYAAIMERTSDRAWAALFALVPAVTTVGWYSVYLPGYPDWALFAFVIMAVFATSVPEALLWGTLALWTHERSLSCLVVLPLLRLALFPHLRRRSAVILGAGLLLSVLVYFLTRSALSPLLGRSLSFYWSELQHPSIYGSSVPLSVGFVCQAALEGFKGFALWLPFLIALAILKMGHAGRAAQVGALALVLSVVLVLGQVLIAVDTVRLMDLLIVPLLVAAVLAYPREPRHQRALLLGSVLAVAVSLLAPITYLSQNWNFRVATRSAELSFIPWARPYAHSLVATTGPAPERPVTLHWRTPAILDRQFVELELLHSQPPARTATEVPVPYDGVSTLTVRLPPGSHYQWCVSTLRDGAWRTSDWSQLYLPE